MDKNTPFRAIARDKLEFNGMRVIKGSNSDEVAYVVFDEDAEFIAKACNLHDELVAALQDAKTRLKGAYRLLKCDDEFIARELKQANAALAAVEAK